MKRGTTGALLCLGLLLLPSASRAFCGFYVASGEAKLFNKSSQVVLVRDGDRTVITMQSDYQGDPKQFAVVVPVPTVIQKEQVHVGDTTVVHHLDQYSAPRLVEYWDENPCAARSSARYLTAQSAPMMGADMAPKTIEEIEVHIEAKYTVGEYDILILSAKSSAGLEAWLRHNGYRIPDGAESILATYLKQNMRFFVAKVNLAEQARLGFTSLRPIQVAYESPKFMLPIRLGMVNAAGTQDLVVYAITKKGRVEAVNYRTVKLPSDVDVPEYVKDAFPDFYRAVFAEQWRKNDRQVVLTEYAWDMRWCDPCASPPLTNDELQQLGVFWVASNPSDGIQPAPGAVFLTRLHVRYDRDHFPEDLVLQETADRQNWQARYVLHHPWRGPDECDALAAYRQTVRERRACEAQNVADLTGSKVDDVRAKMNVAADWSEPVEHIKWWQRLWRK